MKALPTLAMLGIASCGLVMVALSSCGDGPSRSLTEDVGNAFEQCTPAEVRYLAGKHNFMTAFAPCGSNNFTHFAWSPDGTHLYFATPNSSRVMDAEADDKRNFAVPTEVPRGSVAWLTGSRIALPLGPGDAEPGSPWRIAVFDIDQSSLFLKPLPGCTDIDQLQAARTPSELLFVGTCEGAPGVWRMDVDLGTVSRAFAWLDAGVDTFTWQPGLDRVVLGREGTVTLHAASDGAELGRWAPATRGVLHPGGRWLALEHDGEAISIFYQRSWDELSENARRRELARARKFEERLPEWYPKETKPPTVSVVDLHTSERWVFNGFYGHDFAWYEATDFYASLILWGFEGKEFNRNIVLGNLADRLRSVERGEEMMGLQRWDPKEPDAPADAAAEGSADATAPTDAPPPAEPPPAPGSADEKTAN